MLNGKQIAVVMLAYNAAHTVTQTFNEIARDPVDYIILVDDGSEDNTASLARIRD